MSQVSFNRRITDMRFATAVIRYELNERPEFETERVVCSYWIVPKSCRFSVVIVEQGAESLPPHDRAIRSVIVGWLDQRATKALMRALYVVQAHDETPIVPRLLFRTGGTPGTEE